MDESSFLYAELVHGDGCVSLHKSRLLDQNIIHILTILIDRRQIKCSAGSRRRSLTRITM